MTDDRVTTALSSRKAKPSLSPMTAGGLVDSNENSINSFSQIVNNSSTVYNDRLLQRLNSAHAILNADVKPSR